MNREIRSGGNEFEDVNTVVDDEDANITHSDDEKEVKRLIMIMERRV